MASEKKFDANLVVRVPRARFAMGGMGMGIGAGIAILALGLHSGWFGLGRLLMVSALVFPWLVNRWPRVFESHVTASREGIRVGEKIYPREKIKSSLVVHDKGEVYARFEMPLLSRLDLRVTDETQAAAIFSAVGVDAMSSTTELSLYSPIKALQYLLLIPFTAIVVLMTFGRHSFGIQPGAMMPFATGATVVLFAWLTRRIRLVKFLLGADGIRITDGLRNPVFHAHDRIDDVEANGHYVTITLKSGERLFYLTTLEKNPGAEHFESARAIVRRIRAARAAHVALDAVADDALVLARGARTHDAWVTALKRIGEGADATFREIATPREMLLRLVESTRASATERLAAIVALRSSMTEDEAPRVRVAIDRCAEIALRDRMRIVTDGDDESAAARVLAEAEAAEQAADAEAPRDDRGARGKRAS